MKLNGRTGQRLLRAEQLENRELLAADLCCRDAVLPPDGSQFGNSTAVQEQAQVVSTEVDDTPPQQRARSREDCDTGVGAQQRPRDRDNEDDTTTVNTSLGSAAVDAFLESIAIREGGKGGGGGQQDPSSTQLSQEEEDSILFIREEEKLARDVYLTLGETWGTPIFDNIAESEARHMAAVKTLIDKYDVVDPVGDNQVGEFSEPVLQQLHDDLVSDRENIDLGYLGLDLVIDGGAVSELAALTVGAFIEEYDILDIQHALEDVNHSDIQNVYENLLRGSCNHLRSFVSQIEAIDGTYEPVLMTGIDPVTGQDLDALYAEIISGDQETGNGNRRGGRRR
jgi:hypothetical protein